MTFVLDCSMAMSWFFEDEVDKASSVVLNLLADGNAIVPALWPYEVANVLAVAEKRGRLPAADSFKILRQLFSLNIQIEPATQPEVLQMILSLTKEHQLSAYDGAYLELAIRLGLPLASRDDELVRAAQGCGIKLLP